MRRIWIIGLSLLWALAAIGVGDPAGQSTSDSKPNPTAAVPLAKDWAKSVSVEDLTVELSASAARMAQHLKKPGDFDSFIKDLKAEGHLAAVLAGLVLAHPDARDWKGIAAELQSHALELAQAAEAKGGKNFRTAQQAHKKISDLLGKGTKAKKPDPAAADGETTDWAALAELSDVMKRVEPAYKRIRGAVSNVSAFKKESRTIRHEAAILATLAQITPAFRPDEKDFEKLSDDLAAAARSELEAADSADFAKASQANAAINAACIDCHKRYRLDQGKSGLDF